MFATATLDDRSVKMGDASDRGSEPEVRCPDEPTPNTLSVQMKKTLHVCSYLPKFCQSQIWLICKNGYLSEPELKFRPCLVIVLCC